MEQCDNNPKNLLQKHILALFNVSHLFLMLSLLCIFTSVWVLGMPNAGQNMLFFVLYINIYGKKKKEKWGKMKQKSVFEAGIQMLARGFIPRKIPGFKGKNKNKVRITIHVNSTHSTLIPLQCTCPKSSSNHIYHISVHPLQAFQAVFN